jgi:hypothetical protein
VPIEPDLSRGQTIHLSKVRLDTDTYLKDVNITGPMLTATAEAPYKRPVVIDLRLQVVERERVRPGATSLLVIGLVLGGTGLLVGLGFAASKLAYTGNGG